MYKFHVDNHNKVIKRNSKSKYFSSFLLSQEVIANAILNNKIPEAQTFFRINSHSAQRLEELIRIGLDLVFDNLKKNNIKEASELLKNMVSGIICLIDLLHGLFLLLHSPLPAPTPYVQLFSSSQLLQTHCFYLLISQIAGHDLRVQIASWPL